MPKPKTIQDPDRQNAQASHRESTGAVRHLTQLDLARRWRISPRTLERWRWLSQGPAYLKLGAVVVYRLGDVESFETAQTRDAVRSTLIPSDVQYGHIDAVGQTDHQTRRAGVIHTPNTIAAAACTVGQAE